MSQVTLITGGCRSGKSAYAVRRALELPGPVLFLATCRPGDDPEMQARVAAHRAERPPHWRLLEEGFELARALAELDSGVVVLDCVPTWLSNLLLRGDDDAAIVAATGALLDALRRCRSGTVLVVSAEVGAGLVPETQLGRRFRDLTGLANQHLAAVANHVTMMVAGIPVNLV